MHFPRDLVWSTPGGPEVPGPGESSLRLLEAWRAQLLDVGGAELTTRRRVLGGTEGGDVRMDRGVKLWRVRFRFYRSRVFFLRVSINSSKFYKTCGSTGLRVICPTPQITAHYFSGATRDQLESKELESPKASEMRSQCTAASSVNRLRAVYRQTLRHCHFRADQ